MIFAQSTKSSAVAPLNPHVPPGLFPIVDATGKGEVYGGLLAGMAARKKGLVILFVSSADPEIVKSVEDIVATVYRSGRTRVAIVKGDADKNFVEIWCPKGLYVDDKKYNGDTANQIVIREMVEEACNRDIGAPGAQAPSPHKD